MARNRTVLERLSSWRSSGSWTAYLFGQVTRRFARGSGFISQNLSQRQGCSAQLQKLAECREMTHAGMALRGLGVRRGRGRSDKHHFDSSSMTVPGGKRRHFWQSSLSHCAHTSAARTSIAILMLSLGL